MAASLFTPSGPIVLLTDFGLEDPYVGVMHGVLCSLAPNVRVIDLSHGVPAQAVPIAALFLLLLLFAFSARAQAPGAAANLPAPTVADARRFIERAEARLA